jgi:hypothetical protein
LGIFEAVMFKSLLAYPVTRDVKFGLCSNILIVLLGLSWVTVVTVINVAAVGYELVPTTTTKYNASYSLWYERFTPKSWIPQTRHCDSSIIKIGEGSSKFLRG